MRALLEFLVASGRLTLLLRAGTRHLELTLDPERVREILVRDWDSYPKTRWEHRVLEPGMRGGLIILDGEEWRAHRKALAELFGAPALDGFSETVAEAFARRARLWPESDFELDWTREVGVITNHALLSFLLGTGRGKLGEWPEAELEGASKDLERVERGMEARVVNPFARILKGFPPESGPDRALRRVHALVKRRGSAPAPGCPFHSRLGELGGRLGSEERAARELQTLLGAGATTVHLLAWCGQLLADHPDCQRRLREERVAPGKPHPYLDAVVSEALRLYPPAPFLLRRRRGEDQSFTFIPIQAMHRHPGFWERAEAFLPERWLSGEDGSARNDAYLPFGTGPRVCIGKRLALIETQTILAELVGRYELTPAVPGRPKAKTIILTRPRTPVRIRCHSLVAGRPPRG